MVVNVDLTTIMNAYEILIGHPILVGLFIIGIGTLFVVRLGLPAPGIVMIALVLFYALGGMITSTVLYLPTSVFILALFVVGFIIFLAFKKFLI